MNKEQAELVADAINKVCCDTRYWKVVEDDYELSPGFEP